MKAGFMKTSHKNARFQVLSGIFEGSSLMGHDCHWANGCHCLGTFIVSPYSGSGSQRGANLEDEDTIAD